MKCDYSLEYIVHLLEHQLSLFLIDSEEKQAIRDTIDKAWIRTEFCFRHSTNKYYFKDGDVYFNPFHSGHWCTFLYFLSNSLFNEIDKPHHLCDKIYMLNKSLHCCDLFYEVALPDIFFLDHPLGTVIGRGVINNFFTFSQGCTVGNNKGFFPTINENVTMMSDSKIIGKCIIGRNVIVSANTFVKDQNVPDNSIVFGSSPNLIIKPKRN